MGKNIQSIVRNIQRLVTICAVLTFKILKNVPSLFKTMQIILSNIVFHVKYFDAFHQIQCR